MENKKRIESDDLDDDVRSERAEAIESGYHPPTDEDLEDILHDHNTAKKGAVTADEAVRRASQNDDVDEDKEIRNAS